MGKTYLAGLLAIMLLPACLPATAALSEKAGQLQYENGKADPNVIPYPDSTLQTVTARMWQAVTQEPTVLEGPAFDDRGNLYLTDTFHGKVLKIDGDRKITTIMASKDFAPCAVAIARDGRLFVAAAAFNGHGGQIFSMAPDGSDVRVHISAAQGFRPNDIVFDKNGGLYFTDARGDSGNPEGGVYYLSPDLQTVTPVLKHLTGGNGIALSPDGKTLWVVEFSAGVLHRLIMQDATHISPFGETVAYRFNSPAPDSMKADSDGNLYIALHGQGRVIVLNSNATAIGQIVIPGREKGRYLRTANMAIRPGTREIYILSSNDPQLNDGGAVFTAGAFAPAEKRGDEK